jgi:hypothetical protein
VQIQGVAGDLGQDPARVARLVDEVWSDLSSGEGGSAPRHG